MAISVVLLCLLSSAVVHWRPSSRACSCAGTLSPGPTGLPSAASWQVHVHSRPWCCLQCRWHAWSCSGPRTWLRGLRKSSVAVQRGVEAGCAARDNYDERCASGFGSAALRGAFEQDVRYACGLVPEMRPTGEGPNSPVVANPADPSLLHWSTGMGRRMSSRIATSELDERGERPEARTACAEVTRDRGCGSTVRRDSRVARAGARLAPGRGRWWRLASGVQYVVVSSPMQYHSGEGRRA